jgi:hypothetical protein
LLSLSFKKDFHCDQGYAAAGLLLPRRKSSKKAGGTPVSLKIKFVR